jgi:hypothetical protein
MPAWARAVAPHAGALAHLFGRAVQGKWQPTTRLTGRAQSAAQARVRARKTQAKWAAVQAHGPRATARRARLDQAALFATCLQSGGPLTRSRHAYCETCWDNTPGAGSGDATQTGTGHRNERT